MSPRCSKQPWESQLFRLYAVNYGIRSTCGRTTENILVKYRMLSFLMLWEEAVVRRTLLVIRNKVEFMRAWTSSFSAFCWPIGRKRCEFLHFPCVLWGGVCETWKRKTNCADMRLIHLPLWWVYREIQLFSVASTKSFQLETRQGKVLMTWESLMWPGNGVRFSSIMASRSTSRKKSVTLDSEGFRWDLSYR